MDQNLSLINVMTAKITTIAGISHKISNIRFINLLSKGDNGRFISKLGLRTQYSDPFTWGFTNEKKHECVVLLHPCSIIVS